MKIFPCIKLLLLSFVLLKADTTVSVIPLLTKSFTSIPFNDKLWIGHSQGISSVDRKTGQSLHYTLNANQEPIGTVNGSAINARNELLFSTWGYGLQKWNGSGFTSIRAIDAGWPSDTTRTLFMGPDNKLIASTRSNGLWIESSADQWEKIPDPANHVSTNYAYAGVTDASGQIWVTFLNGGVGKYANSTWTIYDPVNHFLPTGRITGICVTSDQKIWVMNSKGVYTLDGTVWALEDGYENVTSLLGGAFSCKVGEENKVWITYDRGLAIKDGATITAIQDDSLKLKTVNTSFNDKTIALSGDTAWIGIVGGTWSTNASGKWTPIVPSIAYPNSKAIVYKDSLYMIESAYGSGLCSYWKSENGLQWFPQVDTLANGDTLRFSNLYKNPAGVLIGIDGVNYYYRSASKWNLYTSLSQVNMYANDIVWDRNGGVWLYGSTRVYHKGVNFEKSYTFKSTVNGVVVDSLGIVHVRTYNNVDFTIDPSNYNGDSIADSTYYLRSKGYSYSTVVLPDGKIAYNHNDSVRIEDQGKTVQYINESNGWPSGKQVYALALIEENLWILSDSIIGIWNGVDLTIWNAPKGVLLGGVGSRILAGPSGIVWVQNSNVLLRLELTSIPVNFKARVLPQKQIKINRTFDLIGRSIH